MVSNTKVGFLSTLAIVTGLNIGGALWSTPAVVGALTGPAAVSTMIFAAVPVILAFPAYFTLSRMSPVSPGHYYYPSWYLSDNKTIGHLFGWLSAWMFSVTGGLLAFPFMVLGGASYLNVIFPSISTQVFTAVLVTVGFIVVWFGIRVVGRTQLVLVSLLIVAASVFIIGGIPHINPDNLSPILAGGITNYFGTYGLVFLMAAGALFTIDLGGDVRNAEHNISRVLLYGVVGVVVINTLVTLVVVGSIPYTNLEGVTLSYVADQLFSGYLVTLTSIGALIAGVTTVITIFVISIRHFEAASEDGILPQWLGRENTYGEPALLLVVLYVLSLATVFVDLPVGILAAGYIFPLIGVMILVALSGSRIPATHPELFEQDAFRESIWLQPNVVRWSSRIAALLMGIIFVYLALENWQPFIWNVALALVGVGIYGIRSWQTSDSLLPDSPDQSLEY